jgi:hypothetical protein
MAYIVREKAHLLRYSDPYVVNRHNEFGHESVWRHENFQLFSVIIIIFLLAHNLVCMYFRGKFWVSFDRIFTYFPIS